MNKTILLVAMPNSVHTARWVNQFVDQDWKIYLFPSMGDVSAHQELKGAVLVRPLDWLHSVLDKAGLNSITESIFWLRRGYEKKFPSSRTSRLVKAIKRLSPDIIHSMEIQAAGYLTLEAKKAFSGKFPRWIATNWGSDIFLFGRLQSHSKKIREVLSLCDYYSCECQRDVDLARIFGFETEVLPVFPNSGGFDLSALKSLRQNRTSKRRLIMLKGYQNWAGRALVGLRALERCVDLLDGYEICVYSAPPDVALAAELFAVKNGIPIRIIPLNTSHREMLALHAQAKISIGLSIGDAISTSLLEAMVMGSFPIQSCTACADEWIEHGVSGIIVPPEDPDIIEMGIRTALTDDELVDQAAELNWQVAEKRLGGDVIQDMAIDMYQNLLNDSG
jgi:glycosyltransferase involved in cell wall biosynthesis